MRGVSITANSRRGVLNRLSPWMIWTTGRLRCRQNGGRAPTTSKEGEKAEQRG